MSDTPATWPQKPKPSPVRLLLQTREAAEALSISERTLWSLTAPRGSIPVVKIGRAVRYHVRDLEAFIADRKCQRAGEWQKKAE